MSQQIWSPILFYGVAQGLFVSCVLWLNGRGRRLTNALLSALLLATTAGIVPWWLTATGAFERAPHTMYAAWLLSPAIGPLCYFYTRCSLYHDYTPRAWHLALFALLPGLLMLAHVLRGGLDVDTLVAMNDRLRSGSVVSFRLSSLAAPAAYAVYKAAFLCLAWRQVKRAESILADESRDDGRRHILWLKVLNAGLFVALAMWAMTMLFVLASGRYTVSVEYVITSMRCLIIQCVAIAAFFIPDALATTLKDPSSRHRRRPIDEITAARYLERLRDCMQTEQPYRNENLKLVDLAGKLSMPAHVLSQLMNEHLHVSFLDFINRYRVAEVRDLLEDADNDQYTLVALAEEAGFKSRASFNRIFRKHTGMPPSEYRRVRGRVDAP